MEDIKADRTKKNKIEMSNDLVEEVLSKFKSNHKIKYDKLADEKVTGTIDKNINIEITSSDDSVFVESSKEIIEELNDYYTKIKNTKTLNPKDYEDTVFKDDLSNNKELAGLNKNKTVLDELDKEFKKLGIKKILTETTISRNESFKDDLTIFFKPTMSDYQSNIHETERNNLRDYLWNTYEFSKFDNKTELNINAYELETLTKEKAEIIKIEDQKIGRYYIERNLIVINFNPFNLYNIGVLDNESPILFFDIIEAIKNVKPSKFDTSTAKKKLFIEAFNKKSKDRLKQVNTSIENNKSTIKDYETAINNKYIDIIELNREKIYLENIDKTGFEEVFKEIDRIKTFQYVENIEIGAGYLDITYKPTCLTLNNFVRNVTSKGFGKRTFYIGSLTIRINGEGFNIVKGTAPCGSSEHPHSSNGMMCLGDGDAKKTFFELLGSSKFYDLARMLWFWIKTYKDGQAYTNGPEYYDNRLKMGYPVFDEKGVRIEINDKERIATGEQVTLIKDKSYKDNLEKFKDYKIE